MRYRYDDARADDYLNGWIAHLFLSALAAGRGRAAAPPGSRATAAYVLPPVRGRARARCATLLGLYRAGCASRCTSSRRPRGPTSYHGESLSQAAGTWTITERSAVRRRRATRPTAWRCAAVDDPLDARRFLACAHDGVRSRCSTVIDDDRLARGRHEAPADFDVFACPLDGISLIEASAGTGKTWNICGLYLRLLLERGLDGAAASWS